MAWHVGHPWETLLTTHSPPLPVAPSHKSSHQLFCTWVNHQISYTSKQNNVNWWKPSYRRQNKQTTLRERQYILVLLCFPRVCPEYSLPLETLADSHHWSLQNTTLDIILCLFYSAAPDVLVVEGLWKLQRGSKQHGGKALFATEAKAEIHFTLSIPT